MADHARLENRARFFCPGAETWWAGCAPASGVAGNEGAVSSTTDTGRTAMDGSFAMKLDGGRMDWRARMALSPSPVTRSLSNCRTRPWRIPPSPCCRWSTLSRQSEPPESAP